jgi:diguanylate cyclase (GGDEF)-like protein
MSPLVRIRIALGGLLVLLVGTAVAAAWPLGGGGPGGGLRPWAVVVVLLAAAGLAVLGVLGLSSRRLYLLATTDELTGLRIFSHFREHLAQELDRAGRYGDQLSVLMTDVDDLREINRQRGHIAGSRALAAIAENLREVSRKDTVLGLYGGDEFVVLLPRAPAEAALVYGERIRGAVEQLRVDTARGVVRSTISVGVATAPACGLTVEALIDCADRALFFAKSRGKNRVVHFRNVPPRVALEAGPTTDADGNDAYPRLDTPIEPLPAFPVLGRGPKHTRS